jgi:hypothetical protein
MCDRKQLFSRSLKKGYKSFINKKQMKKLQNFNQ